MYLKHVKTDRYGFRVFARFNFCELKIKLQNITQSKSKFSKNPHRVVMPWDTPTPLAGSVTSCGDSREVQNINQILENP